MATYRLASSAQKALTEKMMSQDPWQTYVLIVGVRQYKNTKEHGGDNWYVYIGTTEKVPEEVVFPETYRTVPVVVCRHGDDIP